MALFAIMAFDPATFAAWLVIGLASGWLATKMMGDASYGGMGDVILGGIGGLAGGFTFGLFNEGTGGWVSMLFAFVGTCLLIAGARTLAIDRSA